MLLDWKLFRDTLVPLIPLKSTSLFCKTPLTLGNHLWVSVTQNMQMWPQIPLAASRMAGLGRGNLCTQPRAQLSKAPEPLHCTNLVGTTHPKIMCLREGRHRVGWSSCAKCAGCAGLANAVISQKSRCLLWGTPGERGCVHGCPSFSSKSLWQPGTTALPISHRFSDSGAMEQRLCSNLEVHCNHCACLKGLNIIFSVYIFGSSLFTSGLWYFKSSCSDEFIVIIYLEKWSVCSYLSLHLCLIAVCARRD